MNIKSMKTFALCLFCQLALLHLSAQDISEPAIPKPTRQIGLTASWLSGYSSVFDIENIDHPGQAVSLNWGLNTFTGSKRKGKLGFNVQLDYAAASSDFERLEEDLFASLFRDTLLNVRGGHLDYQSVSLLIPAYYRYYFGKKIFASVNLGIRLALFDDISFAYTAFDYVLSTDEVLNLQEERIEEVDQRLTNESLAIGLGLSFEKVELELKVGNRGINFNHSYLFPGDRTEISLTGMYKL